MFHVPTSQINSSATCEHFTNWNPKIRYFLEPYPYLTVTAGRFGTLQGLTTNTLDSYVTTVQNDVKLLYTGWNDGFEEPLTAAMTLNYTTRRRRYCADSPQ